MCFAGRRQPHLLFNNCEHFVTWCIQERAENRQVSMAATTLGSAALSVRALPLLCSSRWLDPFLTAPAPGLGRLIETVSSGQLAVTAAQVLGRVVRVAGRF
ncbi:lecithin retinol acyltransferase family protein [Laribacter hongkongensis]|uniref:lecithin retinol acyltransferase family protein n=1 Tax=Laribacter hongkongensis TaxID=168471 RepID=UPI001EFC6874|nr:lecithin retinol acyltransferase family protein [Laribacter hongkongensis]MCG9124261.1 lecithin retinol acyltransferase family protein [Laribacter hongkongensis]